MYIAKAGMLRITALHHHIRKRWRVACRLNVGNLHETGRSTEPAPPAASAELLPIKGRKISSAFRKERQADCQRNPAKRLKALTSKHFSGQCFQN